MAKAQIWECRVSDGTRHYFESESEALFFRDDSVAAGFTVQTQPIPLPQTSKAFVAFMEREFAGLRKLILSARELADD